MQHVIDVYLPNNNHKSKQHTKHSRSYKTVKMTDTNRIEKNKKKKEQTH